MIGLLGSTPKTITEDGRLKTNFFRDFGSLAVSHIRQGGDMKVLVSTKWTCRTLLDALSYYKEWKPVYALSDEDFSKVFCVCYSADVLEMLHLPKRVFRDISDPKVDTSRTFDNNKEPYGAFESLRSRLNNVQPNTNPGQQFLFVDMRPKFSI